MSEDGPSVTEIMNTSTIEIPANILYVLVQYVEVSVSRGGIRAGELTTIGNCYETATRILNNLIEIKKNNTEKVENKPKQESEQKRTAKKVARQ